MNKSHGKITLLLIPIAAALCFSSRTATAQTTITVYNGSSKEIFVTGTQEKVQIIASADGREVDKELSASIKVSTSGSVGIPALLDASSSTTVEGAGSSKDYKNVTQSRKYKWSPFIEAGEQRIAPGRSGTFAINASAVYYLSVRRPGGIVALNIPKSTARDTAIYVDDRGFAGPKKSAVRVVTGNAQVYLKSSQNSKYLGNPQSSKNWPAGVHTASALPHRLVLQAGKLLTNGDTVQFETIRTTHPGYTYLYCSVKGWTYYAKHDASDKSQYWTISKVTKPNQDQIIREGDEVIIQNQYYSKYFLDTREDTRWVTCTKDDAIKWTIRLAN